MRLFGAPSPSSGGSKEKAPTGEPPRPPKKQGPAQRWLFTSDYQESRLGAIASPPSFRPSERSEREPGPSKHRHGSSCAAVPLTSSSDYWVPAFAGTTIERFERAAPGSPLPVPAKAGIAGTSRSLNDHASGVRLVDRMAAIDVERGAADEGGAVGREIDDRLCHFRGLAGAAGGELGVQLRPSVLVAEEPLGPRHDVRQVPARNGRPRIDCDHAHAVAHAFPAQALREHVEGDVGHAAGNVAVVGIAGGRADDIDDDAAPARAHARIDDARKIDVAEELDVPRLAPRFAVDLLQRAGGNIAGVIDQDVKDRK